MASRAEREAREAEARARGAVIPTNDPSSPAPLVYDADKREYVRAQVGGATDPSTGESPSG